jgi:hypothetical protein
MASRYRVEVSHKPGAPAVIGVFADDYENAYNAASAFFKAYPKNPVTIYDLEGINPPERLVAEMRSISPAGTLVLKSLAFSQSVSTGNPH